MICKSSLMSRYGLLFIISALLDFSLFASTEKIKGIEAVLDFDRIPLINELSNSDILFRQYSEEVRDNYILMPKKIAKRELFSQGFYSYVPKQNDTVFSIASRCNIPYETIACINKIVNADEVLEGRTIILPTARGLFIPDPGLLKTEKPESALETLIQKNHSGVLEQPAYLCYTLSNRTYCFIPDERFNQTERTFFLDASMRLPLNEYQLSSGFGMRPCPFTGKGQFHRGIDMAAPVGTEVHACKSGRIKQCVKNNAVFGNYILIEHSNGISSFYAHLSEIFVKQGSAVKGGDIIGLVGQTGQVTGPHLHFETRVYGHAADPASFFKDAVEN